MKYGTYTTFDCPTQKIDEAKKWLSEKFEAIDGYVRQVSNPHDFGSYPSFEIDYPFELKNIDEDEFYEDDEDERLAQKKEEWHKKANIIEEDYSKKFEKYL